jgi:hypothetical protein
MTKKTEVTSNLFEVLGFYKSYWVNKKLLGSEKLEKPDRKQMGWAGKKTEVLKEDVYLPDTKKTVKKGTTAITELNVLYGRSKIKFFGIKKQQ